MSLYVRVLNGFYTHRKTIRLRAAIGDAAFWVPPRLWAYASENQPDGCFRQYSASELAMLVAYTGDAKALLEALLDAGFMDDDPLRIHHWEKHNGYHVSYAERAKRAALARWAKPPSPTPPLKVPDKIVPDPSIASRIASSIEPVAVLLSSLGELYNRKPGQHPTNTEERAAADVVRRQGWESELQSILRWMKATKAEDRKFLPQSVWGIVGEWQKNLDRAHTTKAVPERRFGVRGIL